MKDMQRIVDLKWVPWTYAALVALMVGVWAGNRFLAENQYGELAFSGGAFLLGSLLAFLATSPSDSGVLHCQSDRRQPGRDGVASGGGQDWCYQTGYRLALPIRALPRLNRHALTEPRGALLPDGFLDPRDVFDPCHRAVPGQSRRDRDAGK